MKNYVDAGPILEQIMKECPELTDRIKDFIDRVKQRARAENSK